MSVNWEGGRETVDVSLLAMAAGGSVRIDGDSGQNRKKN